LRRGRRGGWGGAGGGGLTRDSTFSLASAGVLAGPEEAARGFTRAVTELPLRRASLLLIDMAGKRWGGGSGCDRGGVRGAWWKRIGGIAVAGARLRAHHHPAKGLRKSTPTLR
jgi:hypothetical protein